MKVIFDHQAFDKQTHGGISRSFAQLYKNMPAGVDSLITVRETDNAYLRQLGFSQQGHRMRHFTPIPSEKLNTAIFRIYNRLCHLGYGIDYNRRLSLKTLAAGDYDIWHPTFFDDYFIPLLNGKPFVLTIHDMTPEVQPHHFTPDNYETVQKRKLIDKAAAIVAVSHNTKADILKVYPWIDEAKITVIYHGPSFDPQLKPSDSTISSTPYLLYVGHRWKYKNFGLFARYIAPVLKRHPDLRVICTGEPFYQFETEMLSALGVADRFTSIYIATDQQLIDLYHGAEAFVYPSAAEGFGMPILEAFQSRTVCVLNRATCFPEIAGDAALYFSISDSGSDLADSIEQVLDMTPRERQALLDRQDLRLKEFSWAAAAEALVNVYQSVI